MHWFNGKRFFPDFFPSGIFAFLFSVLIIWILLLILWIIWDPCESYWDIIHSVKESVVGFELLQLWRKLGGHLWGVGFDLLLQPWKKSGGYLRWGYQEKKISPIKEKQGLSSCGNTAIKSILGFHPHDRMSRNVSRNACGALESTPSPHGGRGALPSEGGSPSDLLFLAGGGRDQTLCCPAHPFLLSKEEIIWER